MLNLLGRGGNADQRDCSNRQGLKPFTLSSNLRKAKSTPALRVRTGQADLVSKPLHSAYSVLNTSLSSPAPFQLDAGSSEPIFATDRPASNYLPLSKLLLPKALNPPDRDPGTSTSNSQKFRSRMWSFARMPKLTARARGLKIADTSTPEPSSLDTAPSMACGSKDDTRSIFDGPRFHDQYGQHMSGMSFFRGGISIAHRFFGRLSEEHTERDLGDVSEVSIDEEDDPNVLYSEVMIPLDFPRNVDEDEEPQTPLTPFVKKFREEPKPPGFEDHNIKIRLVPSSCSLKDESSQKWTEDAPKPCLDSPMPSCLPSLLADVHPNFFTSGFPESRIQAINRSPRFA